MDVGPWLRFALYGRMSRLMAVAPSLFEAIIVDPARAQWASGSPRSSMRGNGRPPPPGFVSAPMWTLTSYSTTRLGGKARADLEQYAYLVRKLGKGTGIHAALPDRRTAPHSAGFSKPIEVEAIVDQIEKCIADPRCG